MTNLERLDLRCVAVSQWNEPVVRKNLVGTTPQSFRVDIRDAIHLRASGSHQGALGGKSIAELTKIEQVVGVK